MPPRQQNHGSLLHVENWSTWLDENLQQSPENPSLGRPVSTTLDYEASVQAGWPAILRLLAMGWHYQACRRPYPSDHLIASCRQQHQIVNRIENYGLPPP